MSGLFSCLITHRENTENCTIKKFLEAIADGKICTRVYTYMLVSDSALVVSDSITHGLK